MFVRWKFQISFLKNNQGYWIFKAWLTSKLSAGSIKKNKRLVFKTPISFLLYYLRIFFINFPTFRKRKPIFIWKRLWNLYWDLFCTFNLDTNSNSYFTIPEINLYFPIKVFNICPEEVNFSLYRNVDHKGQVTCVVETLNWLLEALMF